MNLLFRIASPLLLVLCATLGLSYEISAEALTISSSEHGRRGAVLHQLEEVTVNARGAGVGCIEPASEHGQWRAVFINPRGRVVPPRRLIQIRINRRLNRLQNRGVVRTPALEHRVRRRVRTGVLQQLGFRHWRGLCNVFSETPELLEPAVPEESPTFPTEPSTGISCYQADINSDGIVNTADLLLLLRNWGSADPEPPAADINGDGIVDTQDLSILLSLWGPVLPCDDQDPVPGDDDPGDGSDPGEDKPGDDVDDPAPGDGDGDNPGDESLFPPPVPSNFEAYDNGNGSAILSWNDSSSEDNKAAGFHIERSPPFAGGGTVNVMAPQTTYLDSSGAGSFSYRVRAFNSEGISAYTPWIEVEVTGEGYVYAGCDDAENYDPFENLHDFTGLPMTCDGWTDFLALYQHPELYTDTRILYVSNSEGSDSSGVAYLPGHPAVGDDPFNPVGNIQPFRTIQAAYSQLRNGKADIMLLKRGDVWNEGLGAWKKRGASQSERMIVASYGSHTDRPMLIPPPDSTSLRLVGGGGAPEFFDYLIFADVEFYATHRDPDHPDFNGTGANGLSISLLRGGSHILFEDVRTRFIMWSVQGFENPWHNFALRRSIIERSYSTTGHAQGIYSDNTHGLLIEDSILYHNGWNPGVQGAGPTMFNHNVYLQNSTSDVIIRNNIFMEASSHGIQMRGGGIAEDNLFIRNPINLLIGGGDNPNPGGVIARAYRNAILESTNISDSALRGWGIDFENIASGEILHNVIAHGNGSNPRSIAVSDHKGPISNLGIESNIVYQQGGRGINLSGSEISNVTLVDNEMTNTVDNSNVVRHANASIITASSGNKFWSSQSESAWMSISGSTMNVESWASLVGDSGSVALEPSYTDPDRSVASYNATQGHGESFDAFVEQVLQQSRMNWHEEYSAKAIYIYIRDGFNLSD